MSSQKHLDNEYRKRWEEYHFNDGTILNSRDINWRDVKGWKDLKEIHAHLKGKHYQVNKDHENFKHFMRFRDGGVEKPYNKETRKFEYKIIHRWCIGWTDGDKVYMEVIDFFTGNKIKDEVREYSACLTHTHPEVL